MRISTRLLIGFLSVTVLILFLGYIAVSASQDAVAESIGASGAATAVKLINQLDKRVHAHIADVRGLAGSQVMHDALIARDVAQVAALNRMLPQFAAVADESVAPAITLTDARGIVVLASQPPAKLQRADEPWWTGAVSRGVFISDATPSPVGDELMLDTAVRINGPNNEFLGVLRVPLSLKAIDALLEQARDISPYASAELILTDKNGRVLSTTGAYLRLQDISREPVFADRAGSFGFFIADNGLLVAYATSTGYRDYDGFGWTLSSTAQQAEALKPVQDLRLAIILIVVVAGLFAITLSVLLSISITYPMRHLAAAIRKVRAGASPEKVKVPLLVLAVDEVRHLAEEISALLRSRRQRRR